MQPTAPVDVGVVEDETGALAAELEQEPLHRPAAGLGDPDADLGRAGEADHVDVGRVDQGARPARRRWQLTRLTTPGGKPTSSRMRTSSTTASGSWGAGFTTTVLPMARAGATLPAMFTRGKL